MPIFISKYIFCATIKQIKSLEIEKIFMAIDQDLRTSKEEVEKLELAKRNYDYQKMSDKRKNAASIKCDLQLKKQKKKENFSGCETWKILEKLEPYSSSILEHKQC